jgi:hypothetical protein
MSDSPGLKTRRSPDIFRTVKKTINGLSPALHHISARGDAADLPADYEASMRELVGNIVQTPDDNRRGTGTSARSISMTIQFRNQITTLYNALENEYISTAIDAIDTMERTKNADASDLLIILLEYPDEKIRARSALALGKLGPLCQQDAVEPLIKALDDKSPMVSENAAIALGDIGDNRAEIPLQKVPVSNPKVKRAAVNALARIESKRF